MIIGVMDSGMGGLNVLASLIDRRCGDRYVYFADKANLPYGERSASDLREIAMKGVEKLLSRGANVIVLGCNTLSACALDHLRKQVDVPLFGLLPRPDLCLGRSLMMSTPTTALFLPKLQGNVSLLTPPYLASLIEEEYPMSERTRAYLAPMLRPYGTSDTVYLGCSHYLYAKNIVREIIPNARILDGTQALAALVSAVLPIKGSNNPSVDFLFSGKNETVRYANILKNLLD